MERIENKLFRNETITVDDTAFVNCDFENATLLYLGGPAPTFKQCAFDGTSLQFSDAALNTLQFLVGMRKGGFMPAVDRILGNIRQAENGG